MTPRELRAAVRVTLRDHMFSGALRNETYQVADLMLRGCRPQHIVRQWPMHELQAASHAIATAVRETGR